MAFTYGFYNAFNHDRRYDAVQVSMIFDGIITDGIYATFLDGLRVDTSTLKDTVLVRPGRAWFNHIWSYNDSELSLPGFESDLLSNRIDAVVIEINSDEEYRTSEIKWIKGVPGDSPKKPTMTHTTTFNQYPLAYVERKANTPTIKTEDIEDSRGTDECPFVIGVLKTLDSNDLIRQWRAKWDLFYTNSEDQFGQFMTSSGNSFNQFMDNSETEFIEFMDDSDSRFNTFVSDSGTSFGKFITESTEKVDTFVSTSQNTFDTWLDEEKKLVKEFRDNSETEFQEWLTGVQAAFTTFFTNAQKEYNDWFNQIKDVWNEETLNEIQSQIDTLNSDKVSKSGDTMTGDLIFKGSSRGIKFNNTKNKISTPIKFYNDITKADDATEVVIGAGGRTIVGAGESEDNLREVLNSSDESYASENLHLAGDRNVQIHANCNDITKRKTFLFNADGVLTSPGGFKGNLTGNANTAGQLKWYPSGNTGEKRHYWYKIGTVTITALYNDVTVLGMIIATGDSGRVSPSIQYTFKVKQQNKMGGEPFMSIKILQLNSLSTDIFYTILPSDLKLIVTENSESKTVAELWCQIAEFHRFHLNSFLQIYSDDKASFVINDDMTLQESPPEGLLSVEGTLSGNVANSDTVDGKHASDLLDYNNLNNRPTIPAAANDGKLTIKVDGVTKTTFTANQSTNTEVDIKSGSTYTLPLATDSIRGGVKIGYTQSGKNYPVQLDSEKMYVNVPWTDTKTTVENSLTSTSTTNALSAAQGKALNDKVTTAQSTASSAASAASTAQSTANAANTAAAKAMKRATLDTPYWMGLPLDCPATDSNGRTLFGWLIQGINNQVIVNGFVTYNSGIGTTHWIPILGGGWMGGLPVVVSGTKVSTTGTATGWDLGGAQPSKTFNVGQIFAMPIYL